MSEPQVTIGSKAEGYPCPKDGAPLKLIEGRVSFLGAVTAIPGAWCPECHTVWRQIDEVSMKDLDACPQCTCDWPGEAAIPHRPWCALTGGSEGGPDEPTV